MASPLLIAALCMGKRQTKFFLFCLAGMGACLLSAYINTFFAALYGADNLAATAEIAPVVEEVMKLLPLLFYLLIFEPKTEQIKISAVITALSFATFENICYLIQNGAGHFSFIFFRGIGTGAMHVICGAIVGGGLAYVWQRTWLKIAGTCGLLGAAITFHAIYNLLIAYGSAAQYIAYLLPVLVSGSTSDHSGYRKLDQPSSSGIRRFNRSGCRSGICPVKMEYRAKQHGRL